jgi:LAO/AO transport system kinase
VTEELVRRLLGGERRALARVISLVESGGREGRRALSILYRHTGRAHAVGITGGSGAGKSTLAYHLTLEFRRRGRTVGIVAVDPSSPFTHGALLGDRIRMQGLARDPEVFVRSMATRGEVGGLAAMTADVVAVLDAAGKELVLVETVGAGQDEVEVASAAETTVVVLTPAAGDDVQAMKAGIMEVADILVVNKADLPGADALVAQLQDLAGQYAGTGHHRDAADALVDQLQALAEDAADAEDTPILRTVATKPEGIAELADAIEEHRRRLEASGELERQRRERARRQVLTLAGRRLLEEVLRATETDGRLEELVRSVAERELDPDAAAQRLIEAARDG